MKSKYFILVFSISFLFACNKENGFFDVMPESDLAALEGMDGAFYRASLYNDSLQLCSDEPISCDSVTIAHYDELFHQFDEMFDFHHGNYSHNNICDDHHHEGGTNVHHSGMMGHDNESGHGYEHNLETLQFMMELREMHEGIHPE